VRRSRSLLTFAGLLAVIAFAGAAAATTPPAGQPAPAQLVGLYTAHFTGEEGQTAGLWHLRLGPGHHLKLWNTADGVANTPSFEAGPVSFRGRRMVFARVTGNDICQVGATYGWTLRDKFLRFRLLGATDGCQDRFVTLTPHAWRRAR